MLYDSLACLHPGSINLSQQRLYDVDYAWWQHLLQHLAEKMGSPAGQFRGLGYDAVATGKSRCNFPRKQVQGQIPRRNDAYDASKK